MYFGAPGSYVTDCPVSRRSYRITNLGPAASSSQNPSSHQSIELAAPPISRIAGLAGSPNVSTQRSTPFARTSFFRQHGSTSSSPMKASSSSSSPDALHSRTWQSLRLAAS